MFEFTLSQALPTISLAVVTYLISTAIYRVFFHPLAHFPGPKLAALSNLYEFYYDCVKGGQFYVEIQRMHEQYGPIIRIAPDEIHVKDPDWNESYKASAKVDKYGWYYNAFGVSQAGIGTVEHELHRIRRQAIHPYFTTAAVLRSEPKINEIIGKLCKLIDGARNSKEPILLNYAYRCLATDTVTEFAFHKSYNLLERPDFALSFHQTLKDFASIGILNRHLPFLLDLLQGLPSWLVGIISPAGLGVAKFFDGIDAQTKKIAKEAKIEDAFDDDAGADVVQQMLTSKSPPAEKLPERMAIEVRAIVAAGTDTTGGTLNNITFYLLANPEKLKKLKDELSDAENAAGQPLTYQQLSKLPYLSAVISEGHRVNTPVPSRIPRVNTRTSITYKDWTIPINTPVSITQKLIHEDPTIFARPTEFIPERWLDPNERKRLEKYLQPWGHGSRSCIGIHLAYMTVYLTLARIVSGFNLEIYETNYEDDIKQTYDYFSPRRILR